MSGTPGVREFFASFGRSLVAYGVVGVIWIVASTMIPGFGVFGHLRYIVELASVIGLVGVGQTIRGDRRRHRSFGRARSSRSPRSCCRC